MLKFIWKELLQYFLHNKIVIDNNKLKWTISRKLKISNRDFSYYQIDQIINESQKISEMNNELLISKIKFWDVPATMCILLPMYIGGVVYLM